DVANGLDGVKGYTRKGVLTDSFQAGKQRAADKASKEYFKDWADYTNENVTTSFMRSIYPFWCVPEYATILTRTGWKHYTDLVVGEDVLAVDPETLITKWEPVQEIAEFDYDDDLMVIPAKGKDIKFTPNHRWLVVNKQGYSSIKRGYELTDGYDMIPRALPHEFPEESILPSREAAILGWACTDGYIARSNGRKPRFVIYQSIKNHLSEIEELLGVTSHPRTEPNKYTGEFTDYVVAVKQADVDVIMDECPDWSYLPQLVSWLSEDAAEAMWEAMFKAEGSTSIEYNGFENSCWKQKPGPVMEAFQILTVLLGKAMTVKDDRVNLLNNNKPYNAKEARRIGKEHYKGKVWCPVTSSGTWFMNCNGSVVPTGNTYELHRLFWLPRAAIRTPGVFK
ncbi:hypothetical protein LCGC14_2862380, partial [marine sediment metagenome]